MRHWRPTHKCLYVIPEIHGNYNSLEIILNRIFPLRIFKNQEDVVVFLGDYIDKDNDAHKVIECLISIKEEYKDRVSFIKGNHEDMMMKAILGSDIDFRYWIDNGGISTITGYLERSNLSDSPYSIQQNRLQDIIPKHHIEFLKTLETYTIIDDYFFFHGGFNVSKDIFENNITSFYYDNTSSKYIKDCVKSKTEPKFQNNYIYVGAHNYMSDTPYIHNRYLMLGGSAPMKLIVFELNSMSAEAVSKGKSRIYKYNFNAVE